MTNREQLLQELEQAPDDLVQAVLNFLRRAKATRKTHPLAKSAGILGDDETEELTENPDAEQTQKEQLINLLQTWIDEDDEAEEQTETGNYLVQALDDDRLSDRKLFPSELEGVTW
jgi:hypothetical protein